MSFVSVDTYTNQSIANKRETSLTGASMALRTTNNRTSAALGTEADDTEAAVDVRLLPRHKVTIKRYRYMKEEIHTVSDDGRIVQSPYIEYQFRIAIGSRPRRRRNTHITVMISPNPRKIPFICAMNILATATKSAVPSMLMLQPIGRTNLVTLGSTLSFSVIRRKVTGSAAALYKAALANIGQRSRCR